MTKLIFKGEILQDIAWDCIKNQDVTNNYLTLVKDQGIYLASSKANKNNKRTICYAEGFEYNNKIDPFDLFSKCNEAVGGDDFVEEIPINPEWPMIMASKAYNGTLEAFIDEECVDFTLRAKKV